MYNSLWYKLLTKPAYLPGDKIFMYAWTILYVLIIISLILYITKQVKDKEKGYIWFGIQLFLNIIWSPIFFGAKNIGVALIILIFMDIAVFMTIKSFYAKSKIAGIILIPYFLWILFATYLNTAFFILNRVI